MIVCQQAHPRPGAGSPGGRRARRSPGLIASAWACLRTLIVRRQAHRPGSIGRAWRVGLSGDGDRLPTGPPAPPAPPPGAAPPRRRPAPAPPPGAAPPRRHPPAPPRPGAAPPRRRPAPRHPAPPPAPAPTPAAALVTTDPFKPAARLCGEAPSMPESSPPPRSSSTTTAAFCNGAASNHLFGASPGRRRAPTPSACTRRLQGNADARRRGVKPDLRSPASQPSAVLYAFEVLEEIRHRPAAFTDRRTGLADDRHQRRRRHPVLVCPSASGSPHAPWWATTEDPPSSLLMTAGVLAVAYRLGLDHRVARSRDDLRLDAPATVPLSRPLSSATRCTSSTPSRTAPAPRPSSTSWPTACPPTASCASRRAEGERWARSRSPGAPTTPGARLFPDALSRRELDRARALTSATTAAGTSTGPAWNPAVASSGADATLARLTTLQRLRTPRGARAT